MFGSWIFCDSKHKFVNMQELFLVFPGAEFRLHSQWNLGYFSPNFEHIKHMLKIMGKEILTILRRNFLFM